ncbi:hypothetical protein [Haloferula sp.]|uniref:hypothetical protein n=1 Tax=Haloferula sp. TaxID=2497595 RepID=UPI003C744BC0
MRAHPLIIAIAGLVLFGAGYFVGSHNPALELQANAKEVPRREQALSPSSAPSYRPPADFASQLTTSDYSGREKILEAIDSENLFAHLEQLLAESSPDGLDYDLKSSIETMLKRSMEEDPNGTIAWILGIEHTGNRDYLFKEVIDEKENAEWVAQNFDQLLNSAMSTENPHELLKSVIGTKTDTSPEEAIRLSKEMLRKDDGQFDFPSGLGEASAKAGWTTLFEYYKDSWLPDHGSSGWTWGGEFPRDFDFASFAAAWKKHEDSLQLPKSGRFYEPPEMLWQAWSERDPQAALEFMTSGGSRTFDLDTFLSGYSKSASPSEFLETSAGILANDPQARATVGRKVGDYLEDRPDALPEFTTSIAQNQADPALVSGVVARSLESERMLARIGIPILESVPRSEQLGLVRSAFTSQTSDGFESYYIGASTLERIIPALAQFGHREAEIRATLEND